MNGPCSISAELHFIITAFFQGLFGAMTVYLVHRRRRADRERRRFEEQMRDRHGIAGEDSKDSRLGVTWTDEM